MDRTGTPPELWFLCMCYVACVINRVSDPTLNHKQPIFAATGQLADISSITTFQWLEPVYYRLDDSQYQFPSTSREHHGYFVGISEHVGHAMTFKIWNPDTGAIMDRSNVKSALNGENLRANPNYKHRFHWLQDKIDDQTPTATKDAHLSTDEDYGEKNAGRPPDLKFADPPAAESHPSTTNRQTDHIFSKGNDNPTAITPDSPDYGEPVYLDANGEYDGTITQEDPMVTIDEDGSIKVVLTDEDGNPKLNSEGRKIYIPGVTPKALQGRTFKSLNS